MGRNTVSFIVKRASDRAPIIVGGSRFSGAGVVLSVLSGHPNILAIRNIKLNHPKHHPIGLAFTRKNTESTAIQKGDCPIDLLHLKKKLMQEQNSSSGSRWASTHSLSVLAYKELLDYYGQDLRILNVVRDGRDVVIENDLKIMARYAVPCERWIYDVKEGMKIENHPQVLTIRYEDLAQNFETTLEKIADFIEEKDPSPFINYPKGAKIIEPHYWVGRWQQPHHVERIEDLLQTPGALECLQYYGYIQ